MRRLLGLALAALAACMLPSMSASQALASTVNCGDTITQSTTLDADLLGCTSPALTIGGPDVTLDLAGHVVEGNIVVPQGAPGGAMVVVENGTVRNGGVAVERSANVASATVRGLTATYVFVAPDYDKTIAQVLIENNVVDGDGQRGGIGVGYASGEVNHNVVRNAGTGLSLYKGFEGSATDNLIEHNRSGMDMAHSRATLIQNTVRSNTYLGVSNGQGGPYTWIANVISNNGGPGMHLGYGHVLRGNLITGNAGDGIATYSPVSLYGENNTITDNGRAGIRMAGDTDTGGSLRLANSTVSGNRGDGIALSSFRTVEITGTTADRNGGDGISLADIFPGAAMPTLADNHTWFNGNLGIEAVPGTLGSGNWAKHNGNPLQCVPTALCSTTGKPKG